MSASAESQLVLGSASQSRMGGLRWLSPALVGLSAPLLIMMIVFPVFVRHAHFLIVLLLLLMLFIAVSGYIASVLFPGELAGVVLDMPSRVVVLVREGLFATTTQEVDFMDIMDLSFVSQYDREGDLEQFATMTIRDGASMLLPPGISEAQVMAARQALRLG